MSHLVIVGDCGGTNTRLSLWEIPEGAPKPKRGEKAPGTLKFDKKYLNEKFSDFVTIVKQFMQDANCTATPDDACLACAGPILDNTVSFTNIENGWFIDGKELEKVLGIKKVSSSFLLEAFFLLAQLVRASSADDRWPFSHEERLLASNLVRHRIVQVLLVNDFTAMGYGLLTLRDDECVVINNVPPKEGGVIATIGAGTGLGQCFLSKVLPFESNGRWYPRPSFRMLGNFPPQPCMFPTFLEIIRCVIPTALDW
jgi:glucokinase